MADNVEITAGTGTTVATDQVGSAHFQKVKIADGTADSSTMIASGGGVEASALRVTVASDSTGVLSVDDNGGSLTVDGTVAVSGTVTVANAGTFAVQAVCTNAGTFAVQAAQSGTWNITNVSGTISLPTGASTAAKQPALGTAGTASADVITVQGIAAMTPLLMSLSGTNTLTTVTTVGTVTTITNVVHVDDNSGSLTVDAPVGTPVFVRLSDGASAITTLPVSLASVPSHAVTNAGTFAVQAASAGDVAHDGADSGNPVKVGARAINAVQTPVSATNDRTDLLADLMGRLLVALTPRELIVHQTTTIAASTSETTVLSAGAAGVFHDLTSVIVINTSASACRVDFKDSTAGTIRFSMYCPAGAQVGISCDAEPIVQSGAAANWTATCSASVTDVRIFCKARKTK